MIHSGRRSVGGLAATAGALLLALGDTAASPAPPSEGAAPNTGSVAGKVILLDRGKPLANASGAVVYLPGVSRLRATAARDPVISQHKKSFSPRVLTVPEGATVEFPNLDSIHHNAFSLSESCRFDLGLYKDGASRSTTFRKPGVCRVYCNIHAQMSAIVFVTEGDASMISGPDGAYRIGDVPAGSHTLRVWHEKGTAIEEPIEIVAARTVVRDFRVDVSGHKEAPHTRKDGTPYGEDDETRY